MRIRLEENDTVSFVKNKIKRHLFYKPVKYGENGKYSKAVAKLELVPSCTEYGLGSVAINEGKIIIFRREKEYTI